MMNLMNLDMRVLGEKAQRFFEESDQNGLADLFGSCKTIEEINNVADELYAEFFEEDL